MSRRTELLELARRIKGFMPDDEGVALFEAALAQGQKHPAGTWLEVGAYCGKSAVYLGAAAQETGSLFYSLDHHHGSEENQSGWEHHDTTLIDPVDGRLNTLPTWQRSIADAQLEDTVIGLVGPSATVARHFPVPLHLLFIDGGHGAEVAWADYDAWTPKVTPGGTLLIHDVFPNPADGGRPPFEIYCAALESGHFVDEYAVGSLRVLRAL